MRLRSVIVSIVWVAIVAVAAAAPGCSEPTGPRTVKSKDLTVKIPAIKQAVRSDDLSAAAQLVEDLESDDAAVRLFAIQGLRKLSGEAFGYIYYADPERRRPAVARWKQWLEQQQQQQQRAEP